MHFKSPIVWSSRQYERILIWMLILLQAIDIAPGRQLPINKIYFGRLKTHQHLILVPSIISLSTHFTSMQLYCPVRYMATKQCQEIDDKLPKIVLCQSPSQICMSHQQQSGAFDQDLGTQCVWQKFQQNQDITKSLIYRMSGFNQNMSVICEALFNRSLDLSTRKLQPQNFLIRHKISDK